MKEDEREKKENGAKKILEVTMSGRSQNAKKRNFRFRSCFDAVIVAFRSTVFCMRG